MRALEPENDLSNLRANRATIRIVRHDQPERLAPHKICEYLACSAIMNVLVVECSGGNSRPSCPSGVGGGPLGNGRSLHPWPVNPKSAQASFKHVFDQTENSYRAATALPGSAPPRSGHVDRAQRAPSSEDLITAAKFRSAA